MRILFFLLLLPIFSFAQNPLAYTPEQLEHMNDSIVKEGNVLYRYEKVAWVGTDMVMENKKVKANFVGYLVYEREGYTVFLAMAETDECIYELAYRGNYNKPAYIKKQQRRLTEEEFKMWSIKSRLVRQSTSEKYKVRAGSGFSLNFEIIPYALGYKFYVVCGTSQLGIIPFGNDYLFMLDADGGIESFHCFHKDILPGRIKPAGSNSVVVNLHSHAASEPLITPTDICTFKLYATYYNQTEFSVYSSALNKTFTYKLNLDRIEVKDGL